MKLKKLKDPVLNVTMHLVSDCSHKEYTDYINKKFKETYETCDTACGCYQEIVYKKRTWFFLWIEDSSNIQVLMHELIHFSKGVLNCLEIDSEEMEARYLEFWMRKLKIGGK